LFEDRLTKVYKSKVVITKLFFSGIYNPSKLCDVTRLQVKHLRKNQIEAKLLTEYAKVELHLFPKYH
jgi:hypothetical protein